MTREQYLATVPPKAARDFLTAARAEIDEEECAEGYQYWVEINGTRRLFATRAEAERALKGTP